MGYNPTLRLLKKFHGVDEDTESTVVVCCFGACPVGVVGMVDVPFGVGHESEYAAGGIAEAGNVVGGAVGIYGGLAELAVLVNVTKRDLVVVPDLLQNGIVSETDLSLGMSDR